MLHTAGDETLRPAAGELSPTLRLCEVGSVDGDRAVSLDLILLRTTPSLGDVGGNGDVNGLGEVAGSGLVMLSKAEGGDIIVLGVSAESCGVGRTADDPSESGGGS